MKVSRSWLQTYFDTPLPPAEEIAALLTAHAFEVEGVEQVHGDDIIDIDVLANRSSDCLSHRGIARELSTLLTIPLAHDPLRAALPVWPTAHRLKVVVDDAALCPRYMGAVVRGVTVGPSPDWLRAHLEGLGQRSINNIVDATNYVMFNLGQPLHAFDLEKLTRDEDGVSVIRVRSAHERETITTLTGDERMLAPRHLLIADGVSGEALAIAGIKGGVRAEIDEGTTDIVLEAAHFNFTSVRKTSRDLRLITDASQRFQNEPPSELPAFALRDVVQRITEIAGGECMGVRDVYVGPRERVPVDVTLTDINTVLGTSLSYDDVERILIRFEWEFSRSRDEFAITAPWERTDLTYKEAYIEEIGRVHGYANITGVLPPPAGDPPRIDPVLYYTDKVRTLLVERGYSEILTYTLQDHGEVELQNPLASDKAYLRRTLREGVGAALDHNTPHAALLGLDDVQLFEIGTVWRTHGEDLALAIGVRGVRSTQKALEKKLLADLEKVREILAPGRSDVALQVVDGVCEVVLDQLLPLLPQPLSYNAPLPWNTEARFMMWSRYPYIARDIAVWVPDGTSMQSAQDIITAKATDLLVRVDGFDAFKKDDRMSYAWHLVFQSKEKTLTDDEVGVIMADITSALNAREGWEVR